MLGGLLETILVNIYISAVTGISVVALFIVFLWNQYLFCYKMCGQHIIFSEQTLNMKVVREVDIVTILGWKVKISALKSFFEILDGCFFPGVKLIGIMKYFIPCIVQHLGDGIRKLSELIAIDAQVNYLTAFKDIVA